MIRLLAFIIAIVVAAPPSTASVIPATSAFPEVSGNLLPSTGTPHRVPAPTLDSRTYLGLVGESVTVSTEVAGAVSDGPGSTVSPGAKVGTVLQAMKGKATFYETCRLCGAASGELQDAIGRNWLDSIVTVSRGGREVTIRLDTGCGCGPRDGVPTVIDLSPAAFYRLLSPAEKAGKTFDEAIRDVGVQTVIVSWQSGRVPELPRTDVAP